MDGATRYHSGLAAEGAVARHYTAQGGRLIVERWRGRGGEIDLVLRMGAEVVFVEVKKSRNFDRAAERVSARQIGRLLAAAEEFLGGLPDGLATPCRFDVALVDAVGRIRIVENALQA